MIGEFDLIVKEVGVELFFGSFLISGFVMVEVIWVGVDNYVVCLISEVKIYKVIYFEFVDLICKVFKFISFVIIFLGIILFLEVLFICDVFIKILVIVFVVVLLGMFLKGLVLLISIVLMIGVIKLVKKWIFV